MKNRLPDLIAYGAILFALLFWPSCEHLTACIAYAGLEAVSLVGIVLAILKNRTQTRAGSSAPDLRDGLPCWPRAS